MTITPTPDPTIARPAGVPEVAQEVNGRYYMTDTKGALVPVETCRPTDLLQDELVRKVMDYALALNAQVARFKLHTLADISGLLGVFDQEYGVQPRGTKGKGNVSLVTIDGTMKVSLAIADQIAFGPELQSAKKLVDECLNEWTAEGRPEVQAIVQRAFNTDKEGLVNRTEMFSLLRLEISDERWQRGMQAIRDSIRVLGSKEYVRFHQRTDPNGAWQAVTIDVAAA